jgi:hypothetical protein
MNGQTLQPFQPSEPARTRRDRTPEAMALDNLIRRKLRVSDPTSAAEVATALRQQYPADHDALTREAAGLPFLPMPTAALASPPTTATGLELQQAQSDVERDLTELTNSSLLKDIQPELRGWGSAIRRAIADGTAAARFALDPRQRDRAFGARRLLGDYARLARFVGALTSPLNPHYRRLAQSLDEVAAVLLVMMGDALASIGFGGVGRFLLQVPASELQERRDAVIFALRNLIGSTQSAYGPNDWPRGLVAYQQFRQRLEESGHADLLSLFQENTLAGLMDDLIDRASASNSDGLRALGSTAQLGVESFRRLLLMGQFVVSPSSPPLAAFFSALRLFLDPFEDDHAAVGYRLLFISRPPAVFYGLYGVGGPDVGTRRLLNLLILRGRLAELLDCYLDCGCSLNRTRCQILLDKILYDVDRAIDLYALGSDPEGDGQPERRAAAYGFVIDHLVGVQAPHLCCFQTEASPEPPCPPDTRTDALEDVLERIRDEALWYRRFSLAITSSDASGTPVPLSGFTNESFGGLGRRLATITQEIEAHEAGDPAREVAIPGSLTAFRRLLARMTQELCIQRDSELQWENLLNTMAPTCVRFGHVFSTNGEPGVLTPVTELIEGAIMAVNASSEMACAEPSVTIPPHFETSLDSIANDVTRNGEGR